MKIRIPLIALFFTVFFIFFSHDSLGASYDLYVDKNYEEDDADGSADKPYETLEKALENADAGDKIYLKNGKYVGNVILEKGVELYGQDKNKTIIAGSGIHSVITAKDQNFLKNLTIQGGSTGVTAEGKIKITDCKIQSASKKGIDLWEGSATLTLENSKITKNGKGLYIQKGRDIFLSGNEITANKEEGIDLREKVSGTISGNYIAGNGEGGIEIVVGSSNVLIKDNQIKKNRASGIAVQFYSQASKTGEIAIKKNTISFNGAYGITCKAPSGDDYSKSYWNKSLEILENKIDNNKGKAIAGSCKILEAVTPEEEEQNVKIESVTSKQEPPETELDAEIKLQAEERARVSLEKEQKLNSLIEENSFKFIDTRDKTNLLLREIQKNHKLKYFLYGTDFPEVKLAKKFLAKLAVDKNLLEQPLAELATMENSAAREKALNLKREMEIFVAVGEKIITERENKFSLFGWLIKRLTR